MLKTDNYTKVVQVGNSSGLRLTKHDKEKLNLKNGDKLIKIFQMMIMKSLSESLNRLVIKVVK